MKIKYPGDFYSTLSAVILYYKLLYKFNPTDSSRFLGQVQLILSY